MKRRRVVIRHDNSNKGAGCLTALFAVSTLVLVCCIAIFLAVNIKSYPYQLPKPSFNFEFFDRLKYAISKEMKERETSAETTETTKAEPVLPSVTYKEYFSENDRIQIRYPIVNNIEDSDLQTKINSDIYKKAISIIDLYPVKNYYLKIDATVDTINDKYLSILYTGKYSKSRILAMAGDDDELTKEGEIDTENKVYAFSGLGFYPGSNVGAIPQNPAQSAGVPGQFPQGANAYNGAILQQQAESLVDILKGLEGGNLPKAPAAPAAPTQGTKKRQTTTSSNAANIFYTHCINLTTGKTVGINDICTSNELAEYILSSEVKFVGVASSKVSKLKTEIKKNKKSYYIDIFDTADFSNFGREKWPKSFSYRKGNTLFFSIPVSKTYGDYVIVEYEIR